MNKKRINDSLIWNIYISMRKGFSFIRKNDLLKIIQSEFGNLRKYFEALDLVSIWLYQYINTFLLLSTALSHNE